jgi:hypothetical protein
MEEDVRVPVFLMTGFLESGKTEFLRYTMEQDYFSTPGTTLLLLCEEGEEEYSEEYLKANRIAMEILEDAEDLNPETLQAFEDRYHPEQVVIEYNGMWQMKQINSCTFPEGWGIMQQVTTVDTSTFQLYLNNMKSLFMDQVRESDLVIFNRATKDLPLDTYRRGIKVANPKATIVFEDEDGEQITDIYEGEMPFDLNSEVIDIDPVDYGIWYLDAMDNPERYKNRLVHFQARVWKSDQFGPNIFVPGRMAMTCCADDTTMIGYLCNSKNTGKLKNGQWIDLTARVQIEDSSFYEEKGPVLYAKHIKVIPALENDLVYFN